MAAAGMLSGLFTPQPRDALAEQQAEEQRLQFLAQNPFQAAAHTVYGGAAQAGAGAARALAGAAGVDARPPAEKNSAAVQAAKAQVAQLDFDPSDPKSVEKFYLGAIQILKNNGLVGDAAALAHQWTADKLAQKQMELKNKDLERKAKFDTGRLANQAERNRILAAKGVNDPETVKLLDMLDTLDPNDAEDKPRYDAIKARINTLTAPKGIKIVQAGDHYDILDASGKKIGENDVEARPLNDAQQQKLDATTAGFQTKYDQTHLSLQSNYSSANELYNMPGLKGAVGTWVGLISKGQINPQGAGFFDALNRSVRSEAVKSAIAKIAQVQGQTFIGALIDLKASSSTGASGLGSLTEVEGAKIQNAKAALDPQQGYDSYRANLMQYIKQLEQSSQLIDDGAKRLNLTTKPLSGSAGGATPAPTAPRPAAPASAPIPAPVAPGASGGLSFERGPDGKLRKVAPPQPQASGQVYPG